MNAYRRHLPRWEGPGIPVFATWRLRGSLPQERVFLPEHLAAGEVFLTWDRLLDRGRSGPTYLRKPEIARLALDRMQALATNQLCSLYAYVVMPNHVHVLWTPYIRHAELIRKVKGATARQANQLLGRSGEPFWQEEYFDRLVRSDREFAQIQRYIEWDPVKAALASDPAEFPWSSAYGREGGL
ncbi:MAG TPA: transposase [Acidobacteriaceae bacterium]|nr:transposase [Acidobacteriaceae bacterium]